MCLDKIIQKRTTIKDMIVKKAMFINKSINKNLIWIESGLFMGYKVEHGVNEDENYYNIYLNSSLFNYKPKIHEYKTGFHCFDLMESDKKIKDYYDNGYVFISRILIPKGTPIIIGKQNTFTVVVTPVFVCNINDLYRYAFTQLRSIINDKLFIHSLSELMDKTCL